MWNIYACPKLLTFLAMQSSVSDTPLGIKSYQMTLISVLLDRLNQSYYDMGLVSVSSDIDDVCTWRYVECDCGKLRTVYWSGINRGPLHRNIHIAQFYLHWMPPGLEIIDLSYHIGKGSFVGRLLPRCAREITLRFCTLKDTPDIHELPVHLVKLILDNNEFCGSICISHLPNGLLRLGLSANKIESVIVAPGAGDRATKLRVSVLQQRLRKNMKIRYVNSQPSEKLLFR